MYKLRQLCSNVLIATEQRRMTLLSRDTCVYSIKCGLVQADIKDPGAMPVDFFRDGHFRGGTAGFPTNTRQLAESQPTTLVQRLGTNHTRM